MSSAPVGNPRQWRFTWETLPHIPTLRLYLFNPEIDPSSRCLNLGASLRLDESLLLVSWIDGGGNGDVKLRVPVPRVLVDPSCPVDCRAKQDHIEIKLSLVLPVGHPLVADLSGVLDPAAEGVERDGGGTSDRFLPLSLDSDLKSLSSGGAHFYCKTCSTKLTRQPLRRFVEMPSVNWREVADNWFGSCCCSFGGVSEKLVSQYISTYDCVEGTCLLDNASVIVCKEDLEGYIFEQCSDGYSKHGYKVGLEATDNSTEVVNEGICGNISQSFPNVCVTASCAANEMESMNLDLGTESSECKNHTNPSSCPLPPSADSCGNVPSGNDPFSTGSTNLARHGTQIAIDVDFLKLNLDHCSGNLEKPVSEFVDEFSLKGQCHCCADNTNNLLGFAHGGAELIAAITPKEVQQPTISSEPERSQKWLHSSSLGNGFIIRASNLSNDIEWVEFSCRHCSSSLGSYPSLKNSNFPVDGGVRLFKCSISTCIPTCGPHDIFRKHSLQRVFVNSLFESAEDELSFRTVVRDLRTRSEMLQIVLLNSKAWCSTGYCLENVTTTAVRETTDLQPIAKVLFSDCSTASEADSRVIKDWSTRTHVEEVYMIRHQIEELTQHLKMALNRLPLSFSSLQGMSLSSIER